MQQYLSDAQLAERYGVSRSTIWRWTHRRLLPAPVQLSSGTTRWRLDEVERRETEHQRQGRDAQDEVGRL
jgi:prophage regulatory protein